MSAAFSTVHCVFKHESICIRREKVDAIFLFKLNVQSIVNTMFRRKVHFRWLSSVYDWNKASKAFREKYYVMCLGRRTRYKDAPGLMKRGTALRFYSESADEGHPGYCSH